jgi:hypothetical protein
MLNTENATAYALGLFTGAELVSSVIEIEGGSELATVVLMVPYGSELVEESVFVWINENNEIYGEW